MGLLGASPGVLPPNLQPEWTSTPNPLWTEGVGGTYDLNDDVFDAEGDTLTFVKTAGTWPTGVTLNSNGIITATSSVSTGTTAGLTITADDGTNSPVASSSFSVEITADTNKHVAKTGSDANAGTQALPWLTVQYSTDNVSPGETIFVHEGTYSERIVIGVSGTVGNYITLRNFPGETAIIDGTGVGGGTMLTGVDISYYKVIGLEFANYVGGGVRFWADGSHIEVRDNKFHDQTHEGPEGHVIQMLAAQIDQWGTSNYATGEISDVVVDGNTIGPNIDTGTPGIFDEALTFSFNVKRFRITNNTLDDCSHIVIDLIGKEAWSSGGSPPAPAPAFPQYGLIAGNTISNSGFLSSLTNSMFHADGCKDIVFEDNLVRDSAGHAIDCNVEDVNFQNERMIYRRNKVLRGETTGFMLGNDIDTLDIRWAHNSVFLATDGNAKWGMAAGGGANVDDVVGKNNIIQVPDGGADKGFVINHYRNTSALITLDYNLYHKSTSNYKWQGSNNTSFADYQTASGQDANSITGDPLYVDAANNNLTPDTGSPAINAGTALTNANGSGSSSQTLIVDDSRWFHDGMGIEGLAGDTIRVGANTVVITAINYSTHTLTLDSAISWSDNDDVTYPYNGAAPDIGAIET